MPKSTTICLIVTGLGMILYAFFHSGSTPQKDGQDYSFAALSIFNTCAIISLFFVLAKLESATAAKFGSAMRDNMSTLIGAMISSLSLSAYGVFQLFF